MLLCCLSLWIRPSLLAQCQYNEPEVGPEGKIYCVNSTQKKVYYLDYKPFIISQSD